MLRRVLAIALVPCLLLPPAEAMGHSHPDVQPAGHSRPHFHIAAIAHCHEHEAGGHHHDECEAEDESALNQVALPDHDDDAVFLTAGTFASGFDTSVNGMTGSLKQPICFGHSLFVLVGESSYAQHPHPPPLTVPDCPLYLLHLALLI